MLQPHIQPVLMPADTSGQRATTVLILTLFEGCSLRGLTARLSSNGLSSIIICDDVV